MIILTLNNILNYKINPRSPDLFIYMKKGPNNFDRILKVQIGSWPNTLLHSTIFQQYLSFQHFWGTYTEVTEPIIQDHFACGLNTAMMSKSRLIHTSFQCLMYTLEADFLWPNTSTMLQWDPSSFSRGYNMYLGHSLLIAVSKCVSLK